MKTFLIIYTICVLSVITFQNPISSNLFNKDLIGEPTSVNFLSEKEILISSLKGLISKVELQSGEIIWKKNLIYPIKLQLKSEGKRTIIHYNI